VEQAIAGIYHRVRSSEVDPRSKVGSPAASWKRRDRLRILRQHRMPVRKPRWRFWRAPARASSSARQWPDIDRARGTIRSERQMNADGKPIDPHNFPRRVWDRTRTP